MQLDVESLRTFLAVLDHGGMTRAAEHLNVTQSAVSWKIKRLEERVGRPLLIRDGHDIRPSRDGRALLEDARSMVEIHDRAAARLASSELTGTVRLGANEEVGATHMAGVLGRFTRLHPSASMEFVISNSKSLEASLQSGSIDVAVLQVAEDDLQPNDVVLWSDDLHWVTCCETPFEAGTVPLITFGEHCFYRRLSEPILTAHGIEHAVAFSGASSMGVQAMVAAGLGVAVLSSRFMTGDVVEWRRGAALDPLPRIFQIARPVPGEQPAVAAALLRAIADELIEPEILAA